MFSELEATLRTVESYCTKVLGFDAVKSLHFNVKPDGEHAMWCALVDDFDASPSFKPFHFSDMQELWTQLEALPGRNERELRYLLSRCGEAAEAQGHLRCQAAKEFAADLVERRSKYANLLTEMKGTVQ